MKKFKDSRNNEWSISMTIGTAMKLKESLGIDILQPEQGDPPLLTRLGTDKILLAQVIAFLLGKQFEEKGISETDVYELFDGETLCRSQTAFYEELADFFQKSGWTALAKAVVKQRAAIKAGIEAMEAKIDAIDVKAEIEKAFGNAGI